MSAPLQILIVADDTQVGRWLQHRIETLGKDCRIELDTCVTFDRRLATTGTSGCDMLFAVLDFAPAAAGLALQWLERIQDIPGIPSLVVIAEHGDELTATAAMRRGVADYLPRRLLTTGLLQAAIAHALAASRPAAPSAAQPETAARAAQPALSNPLKVPRDLIPRYMLLEVLGESARATVYLAHSAALDRQVALKVSRVSEGEEAQFSREFQTVGGLCHPGVVEIHDYGMHEGREFIAMEYFPCGDLKARLQNPLSENEAVGYLRRIAAALAAVHQQGILHRDLKPPNIMLREDAQVVLIDFGISRHLHNASRSTEAGVLRGSPYYMSPEQAQGMELDARSDLYSLGVLFYEMLTGAKPYLGVTAIDVLQQHVSGPVPELPPELAHFQPLLDGLMAKSPEDRFASADAMLASLDRAAA